MSDDYAEHGGRASEERSGVDRRHRGAGLLLSAGEERILGAVWHIEQLLGHLARKVDLLSTSDQNLTAATAALGAQLQNFEADMTTGLAQIAAALNRSTTADPAIDAATTAINAMGAGLAGSRTAFDAVVASVVPASPSNPVPTPSVPTIPAGTTIGIGVGDTGAATTDAVGGAPPTPPPTQALLDSQAQNAARAPEQSA